MTKTQPAHRPVLGARALSIGLLTVLFLAGCAVPPVTPPVPAVPADAPPVVAAPPQAAASAPEVQTPVAVAPRVLHGRLDDDIDSVHTDLWARVRGQFSIPDLDNERVHKWEQWYASRPDYVQRMTERGGRYLFYIVEEVQRRNMPVDLALLPFIESAFNPQATSHARASGMWQFMPTTGKDFELQQNLFRDDRRDVLASTQAALDYLQQLYTQFNDWQLALAAYNWGPGNVQRAIAYNQKHGRPIDYDSLRMPEETRNYVPKLQAVKNIIARPEAFSLTLPTLEDHPFFLSVAIDRDIDVALAAQLADLPLDEFKELNPQMNKPVILAAGTPQVLLPYDNANRFLKQINRHQGPLASWTAWVAPKTLKPRDAARLIGMPEAQLRAVNHIPARMLVKKGSTLLVPRTEHITEDVAEHVADSAMMMLAPERPALHKVSLRIGKHGDSVAGVARRYHVSVNDVARWNGVNKKARFKPGQTVIVMRATSSKRSRVASRHSKKHVASRRHKTHVASGHSTKEVAARSHTKHATEHVAKRPKAAADDRVAER